MVVNHCLYNNSNHEQGKNTLPEKKSYEETHIWGKNIGSVLRISKERQNIVPSFYGVYFSIEKWEIMCVYLWREMFLRCTPFLNVCADLNSFLHKVSKRQPCVSSRDL